VLPAGASAPTSTHLAVLLLLLLLLAHRVGLVGRRLKHAAAFVIGLGVDIT
jgi:hypothetical protein